MHIESSCFSFLCTTTISTWSKQQSMGYGSTWLERKSLSLHHLIVLLKLPMIWICFCLQGFLAEKMCKSHSYLAHGARKVLVQEVQQSSVEVASWSNLKSLYCASNNQPMAILWELIVYFIPLLGKCD